VSGSRSSAGAAWLRVVGLAPWLLLALGASGAVYEWGGAGGGACASSRRSTPRRPHSPSAKPSGSFRARQPCGTTGRSRSARPGRQDSARDAYTEAMTSRDLRGDPARSAAAYNLGNESLRQGRYDEAAKLYRQSLTIDPNRADAKKNLEEAIRRGRNKPPQASSGGQGQGGAGSSGAGTSGTSPPGSQPNQPPSTRPPGSAQPPPGRWAARSPIPPRRSTG
jgi:hypothetical protein